MKRLSFISLLLVATLVLAACAVPAQPTEPAATPVLPAETPEAMEEETMEEDIDDATAEEAGGDIVDVAIAAGDFETLVAAVSAAGLVDALRGDGPFTVFAPTDDAFAALPEGTVEALLADPEGDLTQILLYHVVQGTVMAADVKA